MIASWPTNSDTDSDPANASILIFLAVPDGTTAGLGKNRGWAVLATPGANGSGGTGAGEWPRGVVRMWPEKVMDILCWIRADNLE